MSVTFEEEPLPRSIRSIASQQKTSWSISTWMVKNGIVKTPSVAVKISVVFALFCIIVTLFIIKNLFAAPSDTDYGPFIDKPERAYYE